MLYIEVYNPSLVKFPDQRFKNYGNKKEECCIWCFRTLPFVTITLQLNTISILKSMSADLSPIKTYADANFGKNKFHAFY